MRLHWNVYCGGGIGVGNHIMSIQIGMIIAYLTKRRLVLYLNKPVLFSEKQLFITDLFTFDADIVFGTIDPSIPKIDADFSTCYTAQGFPDENFRLGRPVVDIFSFASPDIASSTLNTLGWYSFKIFFNDCKKDCVEYLKRSIKIKDYFNEMAEAITPNLESNNSVLVRRGDFLNLDFFKQFTGNSEELEYTIYNNFYHYPINIHSEETDRSFFSSIKNPVSLITNVINDRFPHLDKCETGMVSYVIASRSEKFLGNIGSTFSNLIQQTRKVNNLDEKFRYTFSNISVLNRFGEEIRVNGQYTWNQLKLRHWSDCNWQREFPECYDTHTSLFNAQELFDLS
jgi:hypothetical protein